MCSETQTDQYQTHLPSAALCYAYSTCLNLLRYRKVTAVFLHMYMEEINVVKKKKRQGSLFLTGSELLFILILEGREREHDRTQTHITHMSTTALTCHATYCMLHTVYIIYTTEIVRIVRYFQQASLFPPSHTNGLKEEIYVSDH